MDIRSRYTLHTAENVNLDVELAGVANRVFAYLVDALIMLILLIVAMIGVGMMAQTKKELSETLMPLLSFGVLFGYHFFQEWLWNGRTVGKTLFNIRVVRNNGQAIGFWEAFGRNLLRVIDVFVSGAGLLIMIFSKREKRLGDYLVGTIVVSNEVDSPPAEMLRPIAKVSPLPGDKEASTDIPLITPTPEEYNILRSFFGRKKALFASAQKQLDSELRAHFKMRYNLPDETVNDPAFLETLYEGFRR